MQTKRSTTAMIINKVTSASRHLSSRCAVPSGGLPSATTITTQLLLLKIRSCRTMMSISRMLDMGGMPSASNDRTVIRTVNASKNSKLQAVAFDFEVLIKSSSSDSSPNSIIKQISQESPTSKMITRPKPDLDQINQVASLLKVELSSDQVFKNPYKEPILSMSSTSNTNLTTAQNSSTPTTNFDPHHQDIRNKYSAKLKNFGLAAIDLAKSKTEETLVKGGDAAGHLAARKIALQQPPPTSNSTRWMANFGASKVLTHLTHRSIKIALLPNPKLVGNFEQQEKEHQLMKDFDSQLKDVVIDVKFPSLNNGDGGAIATFLKQQVLPELDLDPSLVLLVSDRDEYLRAAKDVGMLTCRLQPKNNARRGNVSTHYTSPSVEDVQEVVNEINGISFNTVLNR